MMSLKRLTVRGFKSIRALEDFELRNLNVLIGANGSGKSNLLSLFKLLAALASERFQLEVQMQDGPDMVLHKSRKQTDRLEAGLTFDISTGGLADFHASFVAAGRSLLIENERAEVPARRWVSGFANESARAESRVFSSELAYDFGFLKSSMASWRVYHFQDTSTSSRIRQAQPVRDNLRLQADGGNIAPLLRYLREKHPREHTRITELIRRVVPYFGEFVHRPDPGDRVELEWHHRDDPDIVFGPRQLSDGTLRFICLATLLFQPEQLQPDTIIIDEPELGLHPAAQGLLAAMIQRVGESKQIIISTQSPALVSEFEPEDVVVVERDHGASTFRRLVSEELHDWLEDYSLGELWEKNVVGGRP